MLGIKWNSWFFGWKKKTAFLHVKVELSESIQGDALIYSWLSKELALETGIMKVESILNAAPQECCRSICQSFTGVFRDKLPSYLPALLPPQVNMLSVWKRVQDQKKTTLPGHLPDKLRRETAIFLAVPLVDIFNSCLSQGTYPKSWKEGHVTPVPKKISQLKVLTDVRKIASTSDY